MTTVFAQHARRWSNCRACSLCEGRDKVVVARGKIPADILFIGEAPGESENVIGIPFVGPAGKLLDRIILEATGDSLRCAFTNLVCCIPRDEDGGKTAEPERESIIACEPRLREFIGIVNPRLVVCVGKLAAVNVRRARAGLGLGDTKLVDITHPAAILRGTFAARGIAIRTAVVTIANAVEDL